jgi:hypothetical protein
MPWAINSIAISEIWILTVDGFLTPYTLPDTLFEMPHGDGVQ